MILPPRPERADFVLWSDWLQHDNRWLEQALRQAAGLLARNVQYDFTAQARDEARAFLAGLPAELKGGA